MVIAEPVQNAGGCLQPPPGYWRGIRELCDRHGILLVADEVITGFGRLGQWFGINRFDAVPEGMAEVEQWGQPSTVAELDRTVHWEDLRGGMARVEEIFPGLDPAPSRTGVWVDSTADDETAIMGMWGKSGKVIVATAFSGYGFKICPVSGRIAAELATSGETRYDISHTDPDRFA